jgi:hypothetical protein
MLSIGTDPDGSGFCFMLIKDRAFAESIQGPHNNDVADSIHHALGEGMSVEGCGLSPHIGRVGCEDVCPIYLV